jgi:hypothetical protein
VDYKKENNTIAGKKIGYDPIENGAFKYGGFRFLDSCN